MAEAILQNRDASLSIEEKSRKKKNGAKSIQRIAVTSSEQLIPAPESQVTTTPPIRKSTKKRRYKAGDIRLVRASTITVVVKYRLGQKDLKKFKQCFDSIDTDGSGEIDTVEYFDFIDEPRTPYSEKLFQLIDKNDSGAIDFEEFLYATIIYCMFSHDEILKFAFDTYDPQHTGKITNDDFRLLVEMAHQGQEAFQANISNVFEEFEEKCRGQLDFNEFKTISKRYQMLLFPCFRMQDRLQEATLGSKRWIRIHEDQLRQRKNEIYSLHHPSVSPQWSISRVFFHVGRFFHINSSDIYQE